MADYKKQMEKSSSSKNGKQHSRTKTPSTTKRKYVEIQESKTPPLPVEITKSDIDALLKKRDSLKEKLKNLGDTKDTTKPSKKSFDHGGSKKSKTCKAITSHIEKEQSPIDSEEEEQIIEERRKQRKMLLEKLKKEEVVPVNESETITGSQGNPSAKEVNTENKNFNDKTETTDMFAEVDNFNDQPKCQNDNKLSNHADDWDDTDGYYKIVPGDLIDKKRYCLKDVIGQGVFANVVKALDTTKSNCEVAIKIARNNDVIYQNGLREITMLKRIKDADPEKHQHCVEYLRYFLHKGHLCTVLESLSMDLRSVLKKYGKNTGLNMKALVSYSRQLFIALRFLKRIGIVHADIKPDNILVNEKKNVLKLCDFGSAEDINENDVKPYLVSRFYRAPEIILGMEYGHGIDMWSAACTIYELATGKIMFTGNSNNKMLKYFMDLKGKIPNKLIRKGKFKDQHFNYNLNFLLHGKDAATGRERVFEVPNITATRNLQNELEKYNKCEKNSNDKKLQQLKELLDKMLVFDPNQRLTPSECLRHSFILDIK